MSEYLLAQHAAGAEALEELGSAVRSENWGGSGIPGVPSQAISELYIHQAAGKAELWVKIELAPWFRGLGPLPDPDHDGYPEVYGRARADHVSPQLLAAIASDYASRVLSAAEVRTWANELSSYWYPSFNTDLVPPGPSWPDAQTEPEIKRELVGLDVATPSIVMRGKPQGQPTYAVFVVKDLKSLTAATDSGSALVLKKVAPSPAPLTAATSVQSELAQSGAASWQAWSEQLVPFASVAHKRLKSSPAATKGLTGLDDFLFYRTALEYTVGGDLERQAPGKNPLPVIEEWQHELSRLGVDFLFVPVPAKEEIFPDKLDATLAPLAGKVVNPWERKLVASLAAQGVEVLDLLAPLLAARAQPAAETLEPLYQRQDTHWSARGLELAAQLIAARIKSYPWYAQLAAHKRAFSTRDASFSRFGDLHSRLPEAQKKRYHPETLPAHQVLGSDGTPYEDDPNSPIVILGDSFTGVYQLTDAEHAGLSAHIAREIGYPVDLVMSYGGGPNVRHKLLRRGEDALRQKQLVVWVMADRDLYNYWEDWEPLHKP
jgi:alginate O-acetyltransferase complex protein AlgJ